MEQGKFEVNYLARDVKKLSKIQGQVIETLPNGQFRVEIFHEEKKVTLRCYLNGKMRQNKIKLVTGDNVEIELPRSVHIENAIGRIIYRNK